MKTNTIFGSTRRLGAALAVALLGSLGVSVQAQTNAQPAAASAPAQTAKAIFAGGCFWCVESDFDKVPGVISTTSGYTGGKTVNPTYEQVSSHGTGHAESVQVVFDPAKVTYAQLLEIGRAHV